MKTYFQIRSCSTWRYVLDHGTIYLLKVINKCLLSWMNELFLNLNCANGPIAIETIAPCKAKSSVAKVLMMGSDKRNVSTLGAG